MRVIEGTVKEIFEYEQLHGLTPTAGVELGQEVPEEEPELTASTSTLDFEDEESFEILRLIYTRAKDGATTLRVLAFLRRAHELHTRIAIGTSVNTYDGHTDYLMVHDNASKKKFGAIAYVKPGNGGLTLRLRPEDVTGYTDERIKFPKVVETHQYGVTCRLVDDQAVELALELAERALQKVRQAG